MTTNKTLRIALIGYGTMNKLVAARARAIQESKQHDFVIGEILTTQELSKSIDERIGILRNHDAAIDFSVASGVIENIELCARAGVPLVEGTTNWNARLDDAKQIIETHSGALVYGANFSIGINIFYQVVARAAELYSKFDDYAPFIEERHHARKKDAPSGTARVFRDKIKPLYESDFSIASTRAGDIPGTHTVGFDSAADTITLTHTARTREGFANGALLAARWIQGQKGVFEFKEVLSAA
ncbi:MAG: 4-hydroxy-tetrahydrodipicolinate reductase [Pyrinomonadaceae bacterium]